jgi:hypothetical protein
MAQTAAAEIARRPRNLRLSNLRIEAPFGTITEKFLRNFFLLRVPMEVTGV